jgi:hypothetical protein
VEAARLKFDAEGDAATLPPLLAGLSSLRSLRAALTAMPLTDDGRYEIDFRLRQKEAEFQQAIVAASAVRIEALADDGVVVPGQPVRATVIVANSGAAAVEIKDVRFDGFEGEESCTLAPAIAGPPNQQPRTAEPVSMLDPGGVARCTPMLRVPADARVSEPYWHRAGEAGRYTFDEDAPFGLPFRPTPFQAQITLAVRPGGSAGAEGAAGAVDLIEVLPVQYRYEGNIFSGEKRMDLLVTPAFSLRVSPDIAVMPLEAGGPQELRVTVVNGSPGAAGGSVRLDLPGGWTASPAEQPVRFTRPDESRTVRFQVQAPVGAAAGEIQVRAVMTAEADGPSGTFDRGFEIVEYPHIRRQHIYEPAVSTLKMLDVRIAPDLSVGYVMGSGDEVAPFISQLGADVEMLGTDELAWGDLSRYDAIVLGVRAYETRDDLRANNSRLLEYVENGGTMIVQYNRSMIGDAFGPWPAEITNNRVTDEHAPVQVLAPEHPLFTTPNRIADSVWSGWLQERGLAFIGDKDPRYRDLVQLADSFPNNPGEKRGALVEGIYGKGRWIYVALGLWREVPAGVDGAFPLLANLISLGRSPVAPPATTR